MSTPEAENAEPMAVRRAHRILLVGFLSLATAFIVSSTYQLVHGVYAAPAPVASAAGSSDASVRCRAGVLGLSTALDRAFATASHEITEAEALSAFQAALAPEWNDAHAVEAACLDAPGGAEAYAALLRLRQGEEAYLGRESAEIGPLRRTVRAYAR